MSWRATRLRHGEVIHFKVNNKSKHGSMVLSVCTHVLAFPLKLHVSLSLDVYLQYSTSFLISISPDARWVQALRWFHSAAYTCRKLISVVSSVLSSLASLMPFIPCSNIRSTGCPSSIRSLETCCTFWPTKGSSNSCIYSWASFHSDLL